MKNFLKLNKRKKGFSLVEMMLLLVATSVALAAFVPVITKKVKPTTNTVGAARITNNCSENFSADCKLCEGKKRCILCLKECATDHTHFRDAENCVCKACTDIDPYCTLCSNEGRCEACKDGYYPNDDNQCVLCPAGYSCKNNAKTACPAGTYSNEGAKECSKCPAGKWSNVATPKECKDDCPSGYYCKDAVKTACLGGKWSGPGRSTPCTDNCEAGYACKNGSKVYCDAGTYSTAGSSNCSTCGYGHYCLGGSNRSTCYSKTSNCASCDSATGTCLSCDTHYYLSDLSCKPCSGNCYSCSGSSTNCTDCYGGYYLSDNSCYSCMSNCYSCSNSYSCSSCYYGFYYSGGECCKSCPAHCVSCDCDTGECTQCETFYTIQGDGTCDVECKNAGVYFLDGFGCRACECDSYCPSGTNSKFSCPSGYSTGGYGATSSSECTVPMSGPAHCVSTNGCGMCTKCETFYTNYGTYCQIECRGAGEYFENGFGCKPCPAGYYCPSGTIDMNPCPSGKTSSAGASSASDCH